MIERSGYRENIEILAKEIPGRVMFTVDEVAVLLGVERRAVINLIKRRNNPLPAVNVGAGKHALWRIPIQSLAEFLAKTK